MKFLDHGQTKEIANFLTTASVAWFTAGVIAPLFTVPESVELFRLSEILGFAMAGVFLMISVIIVRHR